MDSNKENEVTVVPCLPEDTRTLKTQSEEKQKQLRPGIEGFIRKDRLPRSPPVHKLSSLHQRSSSTPVLKPINSNLQNQLAKAEVLEKESHCESLVSWVNSLKNEEKKFVEFGVQTEGDSLESVISNLRHEVYQYKTKVQSLEKEKEEMQHLALPKNSLKDIEYYELLKGAWSFTDSVQTELCKQISALKELNQVRAKNWKCREAVLLSRIQQLHSIHTQKLQNFQEKDQQVQELQNKLEDLQQLRSEEKEKYKKKKHELKENVHKFKELAKEKIKSGKAEANQKSKEEIQELLKKLKEVESKYQKHKETKNKLEEEMKQLDVKYSNEKVDLIKSVNKEKEDMQTKFEAEKKKIQEQCDKKQKKLEQEIEALKALRQPGPSRRK